MVYFARRFVVCLTLSNFVLVFFSPFSIAITSLGEERANLSAFRMFDRFVLVWICRFLLPLDVWEGCGLWLWHSLDFSLTCFGIVRPFRNKPSLFSLLKHFFPGWCEFVYFRTGFRIEQIVLRFRFVRLFFFFFFFFFSELPGAVALGNCRRRLWLGPGYRNPVGSDMLTFLSENARLRHNDVNQREYRKRKLRAKKKRQRWQWQRNTRQREQKNKTKKKQM